MGNLLVNKYLAIYILSSQINDLVSIVSMFSDNIYDLEDNTYVRQNDILVKMLKTIKNSKKSHIPLQSLFNGLTEEEIRLIEGLEIEEKLCHNIELSEILEIEYFDKEKFMGLLDQEIEELTSKYNLRANDDFNKLKAFLMSIKSALKASEDILSSLTNQYEFYLGHGKESMSPEYIIIHGNKKYKADLLRGMLDKYNKLLVETNTPKQNSRKKR